MEKKFKKVSLDENSNSGPPRVKDSHYTITPITDATGILRFIMVIFAAKEVSPFHKTDLSALTFLQNETHTMNSIWVPANVIPGSL